MVDKEILRLIDTTLKEKLRRDENYIRYSFFEVNVKYNLSDKDKETFLFLLKESLKKNGYKLYLEGQKFRYNNANMIVQSNEELIAIKE